MLKLFTGERAEPCALLLGGFDGFHRGHRSLLEEAKKSGLPVGLTTISGGKAGGDVFTFPERETIFYREGFAFTEEIVFTDQVKNTPAERFLEELFSKIPARAVYCGEDFRFGRNALGTPSLLAEYASCPVFVLPLKREGGEKIAVSHVKRMLAAGDVAGLNDYLGYGYFIAGEVEHGRQVGRHYGFPTLNLTFPQSKYPLREGVYAGRTETPLGEYRAIVNVGARPTFGVEEKKVEAYLADFEGDLYGATVRVYPEEYLRPVVKFENEAALKAQLEKDKQRLRSCI